jgi:hypothetical protein
VKKPSAGSASARGGQNYTSKSGQAVSAGGGLAIAAVTKSLPNFTLPPNQFSFQSANPLVTPTTLSSRAALPTSQASQTYYNTGNNIESLSLGGTPAKASLTQSPAPVARSIAPGGTAGLGVAVAAPTTTQSGLLAVAQGIPTNKAAGVALSRNNTVALGKGGDSFGAGAIGGTGVGVTGSGFTALNSANVNDFLAAANKGRNDLLAKMGLPNTQQ